MKYCKVSATLIRMRNPLIFLSQIFNPSEINFDKLDHVS